MERHRNYFENKQVYLCNSCHCHILNRNSIISRNFQGRIGPAYLVNHVMNMKLGTREERMLLTGIHTVADITCNQCQVKLGWKYIRAIDDQQKFKEGKYSIEKSRVVKDFEWA